MLVFLLAVFCFGAVTADPTPVVMWHGMGDCCCNPLSLGAVKQLIETHVPGIYVESLRIGNNVVEDTENSFFKNANDQISYACQLIANNPKLKNGYNAIGFSQGAIFIRALAQRCPSPPIKNLISVGGPQQGVYGMPKCPGDNSTVCDYVRKLLNWGVYVKWIQNFLTAAEYWHDPLQEKLYRAKSIFLADINNENVQNETYKQNLLKVKNFVMVKFTEDTIVVPKESEWFEFYAEGQSKKILPLNQSKIYTEDWLGLKALNDDGRLHFLSVDADHIQFDEEWFIENIIDKYFL